MAETRLECSFEDGAADIPIHPRRGSFEGMPEKRTYDLHVFCSRSPRLVESVQNWSFSEEAKMVMIENILEVVDQAAIRIVF